jgi:hypothetical protein
MDNSTQFLKNRIDVFKNYVIETNSGELYDFHTDVYNGFCLCNDSATQQFIEHKEGLWVLRGQKYMYSQLLTRLCGIDSLKAWEIEKQLMLDEMSKTLNDYEIAYTHVDEKFKIDGTWIVFSLGCGNRWITNCDSYAHRNVKHYSIVNESKFFSDIKDQVKQQQILDAEREALRSAQKTCAEKELTMTMAGMAKSLQQNIKTLETILKVDITGDIICPTGSTTPIDSVGPSGSTTPIDPVGPTGSTTPIAVTDATEDVNDDNIPEPTTDDIINIDTIKKFTGGDNVRVRVLYRSSDENVNRRSQEEEGNVARFNNSGIKFCGKQIGDDKVIVQLPKLTCYGAPIPDAPINYKVIANSCAGRQGLRLGEMERDAVGGTTGMMALLKERSTKMIPHVVNLQELLQVKEKLKSISRPDKNEIKVTDRDAVEALSRSCRMVQRIEELSKSVQLIDNKVVKEEKINIVEEIPKIPTKQTYPNLSFQTLSNKNNPNSDLRCINMNMTVIKGSNFTNSDMRCAQMKSMIIKDSDLSGIDLTGAVLRDTVFKNVNLTGAKLCNLNCDGVRFKNCIFTDADIKYSSFVDANLQGTILAHHDLTGCSFAGANLIDTGITSNMASIYPTVNFAMAYIGFQKIYI